MYLSLANLGNCLQFKVRHSLIVKFRWIILDQYYHLKFWIRIKMLFGQLNSHFNENVEVILLKMFIATARFLQANS